MAQCTALITLLCHAVWQARRTRPRLRVDSTTSQISGYRWRSEWLSPAGAPRSRAGIGARVNRLASSSGTAFTAARPVLVRRARSSPCM